ncbi:MAG: flagellar hook capping FlgD N-terminal domain-containing protein, partial [Pseudomonadota bacterium]
MITPTQSVTQSAGSSAEAALSSGASAVDESYTMFLQLLTAQLNNQDPLNPMDSNEFVNQLTQISQLEQQVQQSEQLGDLVDLEKARSALQNLDFLGREIEAESQ